ncbi:hypothetical protein MNEG_6035 [Monoraphidium neglectum]|uniref:Uncharacterized protein n=1 Tax=Monoraphidium neglectum TaxID=145388 RepID=A0A0D2JSD1_9CHLO|nr:hypothetical protein MNEG_6035 [Monoraphidium neglectum]KIZ01923.1 hypothetical protein MNEG_6035 [Monoraphidium neglectum]|eukprot:XP_013900942.1 hypothetical protein MNEG_6035 [Monoraphidium neglectum]
MVLSTNRPTTPTGPKTSDRLVWLILLPFTLWPVYYWMSIPLSGLFAFLMFGIDEIGVQIEEPFGILPLEAITNTIELNIRELLAHSFEATALATQPRRAHGAPSAHAFGSTTGGIDEDQEVAAVAATGAAAAAGGAAACDHGTEVTAEVCVEGGGRRKSEAAAGGVAGGSRRSVALLTSASNEAQELVAAALQLQSAKSGACGGLASGGSGGLRGGSGGGGSVGRRPIRVASKTEVEIASGGQPISAATTSPQHSLTSGGLATWLHD